MKPIKITVENTAAIEADLQAVNGKAASHAFTHAFQIRQLADSAEKNLAKLGIPKAMRAGAKITAQSGEKLPSAYKRSAITTTVTLVRKGAGWFLVDVSRSSLYPNSKPAHTMILTEVQDAKAIEVLRQEYRVI